jgi:hypothetical protein
MWGILEHVMWASLQVIPDLRTRQPRDGQMKCGTQPANISMIHRRQSLRALRSPSGVQQLETFGNTTNAEPRGIRARLLTAKGHINVLYFTDRQTFPATLPPV